MTNVVKVSCILCEVEVYTSAQFQRIKRAGEKIGPLPQQYCTNLTLSSVLKFFIKSVVRQKLLHFVDDRRTLSIDGK